MGDQPGHCVLTLRPPHGHKNGKQQQRQVAAPQLLLLCLPSRLQFKRNRQTDIGLIIMLCGGCGGVPERGTLKMHPFTTSE